MHKTDELLIFRTKVVKNSFDHKSYLLVPWDKTVVKNPFYLLQDLDSFFYAIKCTQKTYFISKFYEKKLSLQRCRSIT